MEEQINKYKEITDAEMLHAIQSILFVSGDPVYFEELARLFGTDKARIKSVLQQSAEKGEAEGDGVLFSVTDETAQLVSNKEYDEYVTELLQPVQTKSFSQSLLETLTIVAYRQPVTRSEIDAVRGIRSEYSVTQLLKQGFIQECGRKEVLGRPVLLCTTDKFLRKFGLKSIEDLPEFDTFSETVIAADEVELNV